MCAWHGLISMGCAALLSALSIISSHFGGSWHHLINFSSVVSVCELPLILSSPVPTLSPVLSLFYRRAMSQSKSLQCLHIHKYYIPSVQSPPRRVTQ